MALAIILGSIACIVIAWIAGHVSESIAKMRTERDIRVAELQGMSDARWADLGPKLSKLEQDVAGLLSREAMRKLR